MSVPTWPLCTRFLVCEKKKNKKIAVKIWLSAFYFKISFHSENTEHCLSHSNRISHKNMVSGVRCQETSGDDDRLKIAPCDVINWGLPVTNGCNADTRR